MNATETILKFLAFLAQIRAMFRQVHLFAEKSPAIHSVSTMVIPFMGKPSDYADNGVTISVALNAEVIEPADPEKKAMGMSFLLRHSGGNWLAEVEIGWTGEEIGWAPFDSKELRANSLEEVIDKVPPLIEWAGTRFKQEVAKLPIPRGNR